MLPSITPQPFNRTAFNYQKTKPRRSSDIQTMNQFYQKNTHTTFRTDSLIRYSKVQSKMYESNLSQKIKDIDKQIRQCQKRIQKQKAKQQLQKQKQFIKKSTMIDFNSFDFLTNPKLNNAEEEQEEQQIDVETERALQESQPTIKLTGQQFIKNKNQYLSKHYSHDLKKKFQRRSMMPHYACRRKVPKLYITKDNLIQKNGKPSTDQQHMFRILSKEATPMQIYPTIPNFATVKDNVSKNIQAYLVDYKPFLQKVAKVSEVA